MPGGGGKLRGGFRTARRGFGVLFLRGESERTIAMLGDPMTESFTLLNRAVGDIELELRRLSEEVRQLREALAAAQSSDPKE